MDISDSLLAIAACIVASAWASGTETALTSIPTARARQFVEQEGRRSFRLWVEHSDRVIATILVLNNIVNTLAAALMTELMSALGAPGVVAVATGVTTLLLLIVGEITPKTLARKYAVRLAPLLMPPVYAVCVLLRPVVFVLNLVPLGLERLFRGGVPEEKHRSITSEELEYLIDLGVREGVLDRDRSQLLTSILEFSDTVTREIMVPRTRVVGIPLSASREQVLRVVNESEHSRIPVYEGSIDRVVGVLHARSVLADLASKPGPFDIRRYLRPPLFVPELMKISRLLREFQKARMHLAVVVDEFGGTAGVVALEDVVEEIVGEIQDELDVEEGRVRHLPDGSLVADAAIALRDLEEHLGVDFPDELDFDSLGGFVTAMAGKVPPPGSVVLWKGLRFTVRAGDERRVTRVEIAKTDGEARSAARGDGKQGEKAPADPAKAGAAPREG